MRQHREERVTAHAVSPSSLSVCRMKLTLSERLKICKRKINHSKMEILFSFSEEKKRTFGTKLAKSFLIPRASPLRAVAALASTFMLTSFSISCNHLIALRCCSIELMPTLVKALMTWASLSVSSTRGCDSNCEQISSTPSIRSCHFVDDNWNSTWFAGIWSILLNRLKIT